MRKQLTRLFGQVAGIRCNDDVECVHQARVASRRLRAALCVFASCFPAKKVRTWRRDLRKLQPCLDDPEAQEQHHRMRIAAKRLRYTLEICNPACGNRLGDAIEGAKGLQSLLGDIRDCDVWAEMIEAFIADERRRTVEYFGHGRNFHRLRPGLEFLRDERVAHRQELFCELVIVWRELEDRGVWRNLTAIIEGRAIPPSLAKPRFDGIMGVSEGGPARNHVGRKQMTDESLETTLPGTFYQRGRRWWWRVQLPGEDKPKSRPLRRAGSRETATDKQEAAEIAAELWQAAVPAKAEAPEDAGGMPAPAVEPAKAEPPAEAARQDVAPVAEAVEESPAGMPVEPDHSEAPAPVVANAVCECCSRNHLLPSEVHRIDSGQWLCRDCLAELRRKVQET